MWMNVTDVDLLEFGSFVFGIQVCLPHASSLPHPGVSCLHYASFSGSQTWHGARSKQGKKNNLNAMCYDSRCN